MDKKFYYNEITLIKIFATFFITWFHFKGIVPETFAPLFVGGGIGNSLFFYASGYLLSFKQEDYYGQWVIKKFVRILPSIWVFTMVVLMFAPYAIDFKWYNLIYPTRFWFVNCILCFFFVIYLLRNKINSLKGIIVVSAINCILYVANYFLFVDYSKVVLDEGGVKCWFYFFLFFLWGYYDKKTKSVCKGSWKSMICFFIAIVCFFFYKKVCCKYELFTSAQFIFIPLFFGGVVYFSRYLANFLASFQIPEKGKKVLSKISDLTLDIYIVQIVIINLIGEKLPFPISIISLMFLILISAKVNNYLSDKIRMALNYLLTCRRN